MGHQFLQTDKLSYQHMIMIWYGGLRGAVSFAMAASIHEEKVSQLFMGTTMFIILVTVGFQGSTIQPLVNLFHFQEKPQTHNFTSTTIERMNFHILAGMETILGGGGSTIHYWLEKLDALDKKYIYPYLCKKRSDTMEGAEVRQQAYRNIILWGTQDYARKKLSDMKADEVTQPKTQKDVTRFKSAMKERKHEGDKSESVFATDEHLNKAWKIKLQLIKYMKEALENEQDHSSN